mmetsp:Transcript_39727/g.88271  ORF Transcript_39727/g.88271 Transcript_39727/m.88271 type:complete len:390 (+) Transcript_39727:1185-2354(+)
MVSCTPWNTNFWEPYPCTASTPLHRKMSLAFSARMSLMNMLKRYSSRAPRATMPTLLTSDRSCSFFLRRLGRRVCCVISSSHSLQCSSHGSSSGRLLPTPGPACSSPPAVQASAPSAAGNAACSDTSLYLPRSTACSSADSSMPPALVVPDVPGVADLVSALWWWCPSEPVISGPASSSESEWRKLGSTSKALLMEKELIPSSLSRDGLFAGSFSWHSTNDAVLLILRMARTTFSLPSSSTRSILFRRIRSEKAICCTASLIAPSGLCSSRCCNRYRASTTQIMLSSLNLLATQGLAKNVNATGAGSAKPVVSMMMASTFLALRLDRLSISAKAFTISLRREQQTQPFSRETRSSFSSRLSATSSRSMFTSPNSFSITAMLLLPRSLSK